MIGVVSSSSSSRNRTRNRWGKITDLESVVVCGFLSSSSFTPFCFLGLITHPQPHQQCFFLNLFFFFSGFFVFHGTVWSFLLLWWFLNNDLQLPHLQFVSVFGPTLVVFPFSSFSVSPASSYSVTSVSTGACGHRKITHAHTYTERERHTHAPTHTQTKRQTAPWVRTRGEDCPLRRNVEEESVACRDDFEGFPWRFDSFRSASSICSWNVSEVPSSVCFSTLLTVS